MHNELKDSKFKGVENKKFQFMKSFESFLECKTKSEKPNDHSCFLPSKFFYIKVNENILKLGLYEVGVKGLHNCCIWF